MMKRFLKRWLLRLAVVPTAGLLMGVMCNPGTEPEGFDFVPAYIKMSFVVSGMGGEYGSYTLKKVEMAVLEDEAEAVWCDHTMTKTVSNGNNIVGFYYGGNDFVYTVGEEQQLVARIYVEASEEGQMWIYEKLYDAGQSYKFEPFATVELAATFTQPTRKEEL